MTNQPKPCACGQPRYTPPGKPPNKRTGETTPLGHCLRCIQKRRNLTRTRLRAASGRTD